MPFLRADGRGGPRAHALAPPILGFCCALDADIRPTLGPVIGLRQCCPLDPLSDDQLGCPLGCV